MARRGKTKLGPPSPASAEGQAVTLAEQYLHAAHSRNPQKAAKKLGFRAMPGYPAEQQLRDAARELSQPLREVNP